MRQTLAYTAPDVSRDSRMTTNSTTTSAYDTSLDYRSVMFCHARLYILADTYDTLLLAELTVFRPQELLVQYKLDQVSTVIIVELIKYIGEHTSVDPDHCDPLKELLVCFAASKMEELSQVAEFRALLRDGGCFVDRLICRVAERLSG